MANRRISEFPLIGGSEIDEPDLLTLVHVFEVDPVLRNKKITFSGFKDYLNQYYIQGSGNLFNGDLVIDENLIVSGTTTLVGDTTANEFQASGLGTFSGVFVQNNLDVTTKISGQTVTGTTANFVTVSGTTITGETGNFTDITGSTLAITTPSGATAAIVCSGVVSGGTGGFIIQGPLVILP